MMKVRITWVEIDSESAAGRGFDEVIESDSITEARQAALHYGECEGIDLDRYEPIVEQVP